MRHLLTFTILATGGLLVWKLTQPSPVEAEIMIRRQALTTVDKLVPDRLGQMALWPQRVQLTILENIAPHTTFEKLLHRLLYR